MKQYIKYVVCRLCVCVCTFRSVAILAPSFDPEASGWPAPHRRVAHGMKSSNKIGPSAAPSINVNVNTTATNSSVPPGALAAASASAGMPASSSEPFLEPESEPLQSPAGQPGCQLPTGALSGARVGAHDMLVVEKYSKEKKKGTPRCVSRVPTGTFHYPAPSQSASTYRDRGLAAYGTWACQPMTPGLVTGRAGDSSIDPMARGSVHEVQPPFDMGVFDAGQPGCQLPTGALSGARVGAHDMLVVEKYSKEKKKCGAKGEVLCVPTGTFHYAAPSQSASTYGTIQDRGHRAGDSSLDPIARGSVHEVQPPFDMGIFDATPPLFFAPPDRNGTLRYYVFTQCDSKPGIIGIWYTTWQVVRSHLPNPNLTLCHDTEVHSFEYYADAINYWVQVHGVVAFRRCT